MGSKPKSLLHFIMEFRVRNYLRVVICTRKPCISTCSTEETNFYKLAAHFMLRKFEKHVELITGTNDRKTPQKTL